MPDLNQYSAGGGLLLSYEFWVAFVGLLVLIGSVNRMSASIRHWLFVLVNGAFLFYFTGIGIGHLVGLFGSLSILYLAGKRIAANPKNGRTVFLVSLGISVGLWAIGKGAAGVGNQKNPLRWLFFVGVSFLVVKVWSFLKDVRDRRIIDLSFAGFLNYCMYFPCFISGPMHYYGEFSDAFERRLATGIIDVVHHMYRILYGMMKVRVLAVALRPYSLVILQDVSLRDTSAPELLGRAFVYSAVLYLDFSGYCDIAIGASRLLGVSVPENFILPYLATNIRDFWQRWHMTFTRFVTQYVFIPFVRTCQVSLAVKATPILGVIAYLVTFAFVGFWHGAGSNFLVWGIWHGTGMALYDLYRRRFAKDVAWWERVSGPWTLARRAVAIGITFSFVSVGWILFVLPVGFFF